MTRDDEIFEGVFELPAAERAAYLDRECGGDVALRARIVALLAGYQAAGSFLDASAVDRPAGPDTEKPGEQIGRYTLLRRIGEGGCGGVHLAEQQKPIRRQVALKVIKLGMDTRQVVQRFEAERQALALMDHPDIAKVFEAGATDSGRPFFAMEFVDGVPITKFCDDHGLSTPVRLELFARVCHAVQHAHQKGVIHRDLKPSNILVARPGAPAIAAAPKIIDFGIAKATEGRLTDATIATALGQFIGTPAYMSPEQAEIGGNVDTRSDIYSLGVLLYELLTGRTPFEPKDLLQGGLAEMRRQIGHVDPPTPSTRLKTLDQDTLNTTAERRHTAPLRLIETVRGDLDWIVMRCLEKDRDRRYDSAASLAQDVQRHLNHEPIEARPATAAYRFRKLVRRNRLAFAAAAAVVLALVGGVVASTWQAIRASRAEGVARNEAAIASAVNDFLISDLLRQADSSVQADSLAKAASKETANPDLKVREALDRAAQKVGRRFEHQPLTEAAVRTAIGESYLGLGLPAQAEPHFKRAVELRSRLLGSNHPGTLEAITHLADAYADQGKRADAVPLHEQTLAIQTKLLGAEHPDTLNSMTLLASGYVGLGKHAEAVAVQGRVVEVRQRLLGPDHALTLRAMNFLGLAYREQGKFTDALALHTEVLAARQRTLGAEHPETVEAINNVALVKADLGQFAEAMELQSQVVETYRRLLGPQHPETLNAMNNRASYLSRSAKLEEAAALYAQVLEAYRQTRGEDYPRTLTAINNLATMRGRQGNTAEEQSLLTQVLAAQRRTVGPEHPDTLRTMGNLATSYDRQKRFAEAVALHAEVRSISERTLGPEHPSTLTSMNNLGSSLNSQGKHAEAAEWLGRAVEPAKRVFGPEHPSTLVFIGNLANAQALAGRPAEAIALRTGLLPVQKRLFGPEDLRTVVSMERLANLHLNQKQFAEAEPLLRELLAMREKKQADDSLTFSTRSVLGGALAGRRQFTEAEPLLLSAYEGMKAREAKIPPANRGRIKEALERLVQFYTATEQPGKAAAWRTTLEEHVTKTRPPPAKR